MVTYDITKVIAFLRRETPDDVHNKFLVKNWKKISIPDNWFQNSTRFEFFGVFCEKVKFLTKMASVVFQY